jgi:ethanolamine permease
VLLLRGLICVGGWIIYPICHLVLWVFILKVQEALRLLFVTAIAAAALFVFIIAMAPHFNS